MDYRDNPQHRVPHHIKWTSFAPPGWTNFAPPLTTGTSPSITATVPPLQVTVRKSPGLTLKNAVDVASPGHILKEYTGGVGGIVNDGASGSSAICTPGSAGFGRSGFTVSQTFKPFRWPRLVIPPVVVPPSPTSVISACGLALSCTTSRMPLGKVSSPTGPKIRENSEVFVLMVFSDAVAVTHGGKGTENMTENYCFHSHRSRQTPRQSRSGPRHGRKCLGTGWRRIGV